MAPIESILVFAGATPVGCIFCPAVDHMYPKVGIDLKNVGVLFSIISTDHEHKQKYKIHMYCKGKFDNTARLKKLAYIIITSYVNS